MLYTDSRQSFALFEIFDMFEFYGQVRGIETVTTYDAARQEFVINTPSESAQKYWIGGAANVIACTEELSHAFG